MPDRNPSTTVRATRERPPYRVNSVGSNGSILEDLTPQTPFPKREGGTGSSSPLRFGEGLWGYRGYRYTAAAGSAASSTSAGAGGMTICACCCDCETCFSHPTNSNDTAAEPAETSPTSGKPVSLPSGPSVTSAPAITGARPQPRCCTEVFRLMNAP